jgi:hypothetical protein
MQSRRAAAQEGHGLIAQIQRAALELDQTTGRPMPIGLVVRTRNRREIDP